MSATTKEGDAPIAIRDRLKSISREDWMAYRAAAVTYEAAWAESAKPPAIEDFLPTPTHQPMRSLLIIHLIKEEYERRRGNRENVKMSDYFERFPEIYDDQVAINELMAWEAKLLASASGETTTDPPPDLPNGAKLLRELARGGMSRLFLIEDHNGRRAVLKQIDPSRRGNAADVKRFENEIALAKELAAKGIRIAPATLVSEHSDRLAYTMPYYSGGSLQDRLVARRPQPLSPTESAILVVALARIVQNLHEQQPPIVHRDLKPGNILFPDEGSDWSAPLIADLGLAKVVGEDGPTRSGAAIGTWAYMAPEQVREPRAIDGRVDVYALGVILYECLTARLPFSGSVPLEIIHRIYHDTPIDPSKLVPDVPEALDRVVRNCLEKDPEHRYATARELADDLERFLAGDPVRARRPGRLAKLRSWARWNPKEALAYAAAIGALIVGFVISMGLAFLAVEYARHAEKQSQLAHLETQRAESQARLARAEAGRADANAVLINEALGNLVKNIGQDRRMRAAGLTTFRNELLHEAVQMYDKLVQRNPGQDTLGLGQALNSQALLQHLLGESVQAAESARRAEAVLGALDPSYEARFALANARRQLGVVDFGVGKLAEGLEKTREAVSLFQALVKDRPADQETRFELTLATVNLGNFARDRDADGAISRYREALNLLASLRREAPTDPRFAEWEARTKSNLGLMLAQTGKLQEAIEVHRHAVAVAEHVSDEFVRGDVLATCSNNLGETLAYANRPAEAERALKTALGNYQALAARFPHDVDYRWSVAIASTNLAAVILAQGRHEEAIRLIEESGKIFDDLAAALGANNEFRQDAAKHARLLEKALQLQKDQNP